MKRRGLIHLFVVFTCTALLATGCASTGVVPEGPTEVVIQEPTKVEVEEGAPTEEPEVEPTSTEEAEVEPTSAEPQELVLRISIVQYEGMMMPQENLPVDLQSLQRLGLLVEGMQRAADALSTDEQIVRFEIGEIRDVVSPGEGTCQPNMFSGFLDTSLQCFEVLNIDDCDMAAFTSPQAFDIYMLESIPALYTLQNNEFGTVDTDRLGFPLERMAKPSLQTFEDWAVGQATSPLVLIYNPDILGDLSETISAQEVLEMAWDHPLVLPPHAGIIAAMSQSLLGPDFDELSPLRRSFYQAVTEAVGPKIDEVVSTGQLGSLDTYELLDAFEQGEIAWTIHDTMFLTALAARGYDGPVATVRLPLIDEIGGTAMMFGWGVSAASPNKDLAWAFIGKLVDDPAVIEWALSNSGLPLSEAGMSLLLGNPGLAEGWLPSGLLAREDGLLRLVDSAAESRGWRIPPQVPIEIYNQEIVPVSTDILRRLFRGEINYETGMNEWLTLLEENGLLGD